MRRRCARAVAKADASGSILIDTLGTNPLKAGDLALLRELAEAASAEIVLVMAAGGDAIESAELAAGYAEAGATRLVATKVDVARRYGGILAAAEAGQLAFAGLGSSPEIASGLGTLRADQLCRLILPASRAESRSIRRHTRNQVDVRYRMMIQETRRTAPTAAIAPIANAIAIASGKGGVGKTWLSVTLAHALANLGRHTVLIDGDLGLANVDIQLGLSPDVDLADVLDNNVSLAQATQRHEATGLDIVAGRSGVASLATLSPGRALPPSATASRISAAAMTGC